MNNRTVLVSLSDLIALLLPFLAIIQARIFLKTRGRPKAFTRDVLV